MTQESFQTVAPTGGIWLPLVEYSLKSGVSLSTIRRKIKSNTIPFRLDKGKYLILFSSQAASSHSDSNTQESRERGSYFQGRVIIPAPPTPVQFSRPIEPPPAPTSNGFAFQTRRSDIDPAQLPLIERAVKMVSDAFESTVKEKDERMRLLETRNRDLEERIIELQLLVKVLEEKYSIEY